MLKIFSINRITTQVPVPIRFIEIYLIGKKGITYKISDSGLK